MVNYGPPPVQYTPVTVPITLPMVPGLAGHDASAFVTAVPMGAAAPPPLALPTSPDQAILAAAAAAAVAAAAAGQAQPQGYAEVRGGVTYFNPTAQQAVPPPMVSKRPKAAIPIVDPAQVTATSSPADDTGSEGQKEGSGETASAGEASSAIGSDQVGISN
jgi:hypothetical protein